MVSVFLEFEVGGGFGFFDHALNGLCLGQSTTKVGEFPGMPKTAMTVAGGWGPQFWSKSLGENRTNMDKYTAGDLLVAVKAS